MEEVEEVAFTVDYDDDDDDDDDDNGCDDYGKTK